MFKKLLSSTSLALILLFTFNTVNASNYRSQYSTNNAPSYSIMEAVTKIKKFNGKSANVPPAMVRSFLEKEIIPMCYELKTSTFFAYQKLDTVRPK